MRKFTFSCRWVLNPRAPIGSRFNAFVRCCSAFSSLATESGGMQGVYDKLGAELGFDRANKPDVEQMIEAVGMLVAARARLLHERGLFEARCRRARRAGRRHKGDPNNGVDALGLLKRPTTGSRPNRETRRPRTEDP